MKYTTIAIIVALLAVSPAFAQESEPRETKDEASELLTGVQDNSFLIEEGYNQEPGVVQHINLALYDRDAKSWDYAFTQEWPLFSMKHQLSYTIPLTYESEGDEDLSLGDVALNYRYQLIGNGESRVAVAPRFSVILPTADDNDDAAWQIGIPISTILGPRLLAHTNLGVTKSTADDVDDEFLVGQSFIVPITQNVNFLVEGIWTGTDEEDDIVVSPGFRWAYNLASGTQIVPGLAYAIDVDDDDDGGNAILFYFSIENEFGRKR